MESIELLKKLKDEVPTEYTEALDEAVNALKLKDSYLNYLRECLLDLAYEERAKKYLDLFCGISKNFATVDSSEPWFEKL